MVDRTSGGMRRYCVRRESGGGWLRVGAVAGAEVTRYRCHSLEQGIRERGSARNHVQLHRSVVTFHHTPTKEFLSSCSAQPYRTSVRFVACTRRIASHSRRDPGISVSLSSRAEVTENVLYSVLINTMFAADGPAKDQTVSRTHTYTVFHPCERARQRVSKLSPVPSEPRPSLIRN